MPANLSRRAFLGSAAAGAAALAFTRPATASAAPATALRPDLAEDCRNEFLATYHSYLTYAGDRDELHPISRTGSDFFASGHPVRLTLIEALDTLYVIGGRRRVQRRDQLRRQRPELRHQRKLPGVRDDHPTGRRPAVGLPRFAQSRRAGQGARPRRPGAPRAGSPMPATTRSATPSSPR
jgi:glycosyl hydrolase family 47